MSDRKRVFVVHGHDHETRDAVSAKLAKWGYEPCVLSEQDSHGQQLIDKFKASAENTFYAVVIMSKDDRGTNADGSEVYRPRANATFELGFFAEKLGTNNFCVLREDGVELPGDVNGIVYHRYTRGDLKAMFTRLRRDLSSASSPHPSSKAKASNFASLSVGKKSQVSTAPLSGGMRMDNSKTTKGDKNKGKKKNKNKKRDREKGNTK